MSAHRTAADEIRGFLAPRISPETLIELNGWLADRPSLAAWLNTPAHRRGVILETEGAATARTALNSRGPR